MASGELHHEYTPAQRRTVDGRLAIALQETEEGRTYGPFDNAAEIAAFLDAYGRKKGSGSEQET